MAVPRIPCPKPRTVTGIRRERPLVDLGRTGGACAVGVAGTVLTRQTDVIADKTGWSGAWVGLVLLATVTSLPELATGISSVTVAGAPDAAVGNASGACVLNLSYVALLDFIKRDEPLFQSAGQGRFAFAGFGVVMLALVALGFALSGFEGYRRSGRSASSRHCWSWPM